MKSEITIFMVKKETHMKRIISTILVCALILGCVLTLASCGKMLTGKYQTNILIGDVTCEFKLGGKVLITVTSMLGTSATCEGEYEFDDDTNKIEFEFEETNEGLIQNAIQELFTGEQDFVKGEEDGVKYIKIGFVKFEEVK